jgi:hypothetical protein
MPQGLLTFRAARSTVPYSLLLAKLLGLLAGGVAVVSLTKPVTDAAHMGILFQAPSTPPYNPGPGSGAPRHDKSGAVNPGKNGKRQRDEDSSSQDTSSEDDTPRHRSKKGGVSNEGSKKETQWVQAKRNAAAGVPDSKWAVLRAGPWAINKDVKSTYSHAFCGCPWCGKTRPNRRARPPCKPGTCYLLGTEGFPSPGKVMPGKKYHLERKTWEEILEMHNRWLRKSASKDA